jgi:hypothetical protein
LERTPETSEKSSTKNVTSSQSALLCSRRYSSEWGAFQALIFEKKGDLAGDIATRTMF